MSCNILLVQMMCHGNADLFIAYRLSGMAYGISFPLKRNGKETDQKEIAFCSLPLIVGSF